MRVSSHSTVYKDSSEFNTSLQSTKKPQIRKDRGFLLTVNQKVLDCEPHEVLKINSLIVKDVMRAMNRPSFAFRVIEDNRVGPVLIFEGQVEGLPFNLLKPAFIYREQFGIVVV